MFRWPKGRGRLTWQMSIGRVFLLESPNALDLLEGTGETTSLSQVCRLFGHDVSSFLIRDKRELSQTLMYISSLGWRKKRGKLPIFIHISAHGNKEGLAFGPDDVSWAELTKHVVRAFRELCGGDRPYKGPIVLVISACGTKDQTLTQYLGRANRKNMLDWPPEYVFVFEDRKIDWRDAVVVWTMFYREAPNINFLKESNSVKVQGLLRRLHCARVANLRYFRWDSASDTYKTFAAK